MAVYAAEAFGLFGWKHPLHPCGQGTETHGITEAERGRLVLVYIVVVPTNLVCQKKFGIFRSLSV